MKRLLVPLVALLSFCQTAGPIEPLIIVEQEGGGWWRVTWLLDRPVSELTFDRPAAGIRSEVFEVQTPGWFVARAGEREVLRTDGAPSRRIDTRIRQFARQLPKEYDLFELFSDGSAAIYTGHLVAETCPGCLIRSFRFRPASGSSIVLEGERFDRSVDWEDRRGEGTYVYFGTIEPVVSEEMISVIDPGMPDWLEKRTRALLPHLFAFYTERFGVALPEKPTILFSFTESDAGGYNSGGGTLPSLVQLGLEGEAWREESAEGMLHQFHFLAHEAAHLWNGQLIRYPASEDSWMHEGSADALAQRTLRHLDFITTDRFLEYQTAALNECMRGLGRSPLRTAGARRQFRDYYSCGNMIALLTEKSGVDLFTFWKRMIEHARVDGEYDAADYFRVLESFGAAAADIALIRRMVSDLFSPEELAEALRVRGVRLVEAEPPQPHGQLLAREALFHVLSAHCRGGYGFRSMRRGFLLDSGIDCAGLAGNGVVMAMGGHDVLRQGARVWDHAQERCGTAVPVTLTWRMSGEPEGSRTVELTCPQPIPPRPPYLRVAALEVR